MDVTIINERLKAITHTIVERFQPEKIILFGSYAWGTPNEDSDIDLLVITKEVDDKPSQRVMDINRLFTRREFAMDFLVYTPKELEGAINKNRNFFLEDIVLNGRVLFSRPDFVMQLLHQPAELLKV